MFGQDQDLGNLVKNTDVNTDDFELGVEFTRWKTVRRGFMNCIYIDHTVWSIYFKNVSDSLELRRT